MSTSIAIPDAEPPRRTRTRSHGGWLPIWLLGATMATTACVSPREDARERCADVKMTATRHVESERELSDASDHEPGREGDPTDETPCESASTQDVLGVDAGITPAGAAPDGGTEGPLDWPGCTNPKTCIEPPLIPTR